MQRCYRLESVTLNHIGVFQQTRFNFPARNRTRTEPDKAEIHIFTGLNGCGKSTVLSALAAIFLPDMQRRRALAMRHHPDGRVEYQFAGEPGDYSGSCHSACSDDPAAGDFAVFSYSGNDLVMPTGQQLTAGIQQRVADFVFTISGIRLAFPPDNPSAIDFDSLPDGIKSLTGWVADLAARIEQITWQEARDSFAQPLLLFLDDVDIHLHPKLQRRLLPALQTLLPRAQIFVSTYSPFVVGSVNDAWVWRLPDPQRVSSDNAVMQEISPVPSSAGKSYQLILEEVFDIDEQFDLETEALLDNFYQLRDSFLKKRYNERKLMELADKIRERGEELEVIIELELRQIARRFDKG